MTSLLSCENLKTYSDYIHNVNNINNYLILLPIDILFIIFKLTYIPFVFDINKRNKLLSKYFNTFNFLFFKIKNGFSCLFKIKEIDLTTRSMRKNKEDFTKYKIYYNKTNFKYSNWEWSSESSIEQFKNEENEYINFKNEIFFESEDTYEKFKQLYLYDMYHEKDNSPLICQHLLETMLETNNYRDIFNIWFEEFLNSILKSNKRKKEIKKDKREDPPISNKKSKLEVNTKGLIYENDEGKRLNYSKKKRKSKNK